MRTITIQKNVYEYSELSKNAKEEAKKFLLDGREPYIFSSYVEDNLQMEFGLDLTPQYSLSYCQGDGLSLYGEVYFSEFTENKELEKMALKGLIGFQRGIAKKLINKVKFNPGNYYCYASLSDVELEEESNSNKEIAIVEIVRFNIAQWYIKICKEYEKWGYDYFYEITDEEAQEECDSNQYTFFEDGKVCYKLSSLMN